MPQIIWSGGAASDLLRLRRFLRVENEMAARRAIEKIRLSVQVLAKSPQIGRTVDAVEFGTRELVVPFGRSAYVVLYRYRNDEVVIAAIRHGRESGYFPAP